MTPEINTQGNLALQLQLEELTRRFDTAMEKESAHSELSRIYKELKAVRIELNLRRLEAEKAAANEG